MTYGDDAETAGQDRLEPGDDAGRRDPRRRRAGRPLPQRRRRRDLDPRRGPDEPPEPPDLAAGRRRPDPAHDRPAPHGPAADVGRDLGGRRVRDARRRRDLGAAQPRRPRRLQARSASRSPASASTSSRRRPASPRRSTSRTTAACTAPTTAASTGPRSPTTACRAEFGVPDGRPPARPRHVRGSSRSTAPTRAASCRTAQPAVWRTHDRGDTWVRGDEGLPERARLAERPARGDGPRHARPGRGHVRDETGQLWQSADEGVSWRQHHRATCPEIWAVEAVVVD